jgi:hypothetical protein
MSEPSTTALPMVQRSASTDEPDPACTNCRYFVEILEEPPPPVGENRLGFCYRYPPVPDADGDHVRPEVWEDDYCGEFANVEGGAK